ncbi:MAG: cytochrome c oxidase subunit II [Bacteroidota bacterium]
MLEAQSLIQLAQIILIAIFVLVCVNLYLVFRLKEIDPFKKWNPHAINGGLFMVFLIVGLIAAVVSTQEYDKYFTLLYNPNSIHGVEIDRMMWNTMFVSLFVAVVTNIFLFYFSWKYRQKKGRKALYYPHNNKLEIIWTVVPAIVLTLLIFDGVGVWHDIWAEPEEGEEVMYVEVNGKQFGWTVRYPGQDLEFGETHVSYINEDKGNTLGFNMSDKNGMDDLVTYEMHLPVGKKIDMKIRSRDVLHSATIAHFRVKMDAVPGMTTHFPFETRYTTKEYIEKFNKPEDFEFEMSCQQICGAAHNNMRLVVVVETQEEYDAWLAQQRTFAQFYEDTNGENPMARFADAEGEKKEEAEEAQPAPETEEVALN